MNRLQKAIGACLVLSGFVASGVFGADFSTLKNEELAKQAGKIEPSSVPDFQMEVNKRLKKMDANAKKEFNKEIAKEKKANLKSLTKEQKKQREIQTCQAMQNKINSMTKEELKESGFGKYAKKYSNKDCTATKAKKQSAKKDTQAGKQTQGETQK